MKKCCFYELLTCFCMFFVLLGCSGNDTEIDSPSSSDSPTTSSGESGSSNSSEGWSDVAGRIAGGVFLGAEKGVVFYGFDVLARPGEMVDLTCRLQKGKFLDDMEGVTVGYYLGEELLGTAVSDDEGMAVWQWQPEGVGDYAVRARIIGAGEYDKEILEVSNAPLLVRVREAETQFVVIDLDHTLVDSSFARVLAGGGTPMMGSRDVTQRIAKRYDIIYLTHRPDLMSRTSKGWLERYGYPPGPMLVSKLSEAIGDSGKFKTAKLATVQEQFSRIEIGIGDKLSDAMAYVDNGLTAYLIPHYDPDDEGEVRKMAEAISDLGKHDTLQVVSSWGQIERGIFEGKRYPAEAFVGELRKRAEELEQEEEDDDDDD